jgi:uncharacterized protein with PIN domain
MPHSTKPRAGRGSLTFNPYIFKVDPHFEATARALKLLGKAAERHQSPEDSDRLLLHSKVEAAILILTASHQITTHAEYSRIPASTSRNNSR